MPNFQQQSGLEAGSRFTGNLDIGSRRSYRIRFVRNLMKEEQASKMICTRSPLQQLQGWRFKQKNAIVNLLLRGSSGNV